MEIIKNISKLLKIKHWVKNFVVFVPIIFSLNLSNSSMLLKTFIMFVSFCLISSVVYIMNDLIDIEYDRAHPIKCQRLIASGKISVTSACLILILLLVTSSILALKINLYSFITIISYFVLNIFYSIKLKNIELIDAACIAIGFILRILAGCCAIMVAPSPLVILLTFFLSMFFTFTKRKLEMELISDKSNYRASLENFDTKLVNQYILINAVLAISFYFTYMLDKTTIERAGSSYLYLTVLPFTLIIFRLLLLANKQTSNDDPMNFFEKDKPLFYLIIFYIVVLSLVFLI